MDDAKIDYDKTVFVIDGMISAFIVSIIANNRKVNCIYEVKKGFESLETIFDLLLAGKNVFIKNRYCVPHRYYLMDRKKPISSLKALFSFKSQLSTVPLHECEFYAGATTSSIMSMVYPEKRKIFIDHGTSDYYDRKFGTKSSMRNTMLYLLFRSLGLPNLYYSKYRTGFTLCKLKEDNFIHVDYRCLESDAIADYLLPLIDDTNKQTSSTLVLTTSSWHDKDGIDGDTISFDEINIQMIERSASKDEKIYIKYHPSLRYASDIKIELLAKLKAIGYDAVNIDDMMPDGLGLLIPAEAIFKYCNFNKVICEESSLLWNISHVHGLEVIADPKLFENYFGYARTSQFVDSLNNVVANKITIRE